MIPRNDERRERVSRRYTSGDSIAAIARDENVKRSTVIHYLDTSGVQRREKQGTQSTVQSIPSIPPVPPMPKAKPKILLEIEQEEEEAAKVYRENLDKPQVIEQIKEENSSELRKINAFRRANGQPPLGA